MLVWGGVRGGREGRGTVDVGVRAGDRALLGECVDFRGGCEVEELQVRGETEAVADFVDAAAEVGRVDWEVGRVSRM